jgi:hypothetical protein
MATSGQAHFKGKIVEVMIEQVELPNGRTMELEIVRHPGGLVTERD